MTDAPSDLLSCRSFLMPWTGLTPDELGIVGDSAHGDSGYHVGNPPSTDYSVRESSRDAHPDGYASALDIGGAWSGFRALTLAIVNACRAGDPRTASIREVIYTPDGVSVRRWDRLGIRSGGDSSHLSHTHVSFFRDSRGRRAGDDDFLGLLRAIHAGAPLPPTQAPNPDPSGDAVTTRLPTISRGSTGQHVKDAQALLNAHGGNTLAVDGDFGPLTQAATVAFQERVHAANSVRSDGTGDGIIGQGTWSALLDV